MSRPLLAAADLGLSLPTGQPLLERWLTAARRSLPPGAGFEERAGGGEASPDLAVDRADVDAVLAGDGDAYGRLVRRHQDRIARLMHRFTRDRGELEELVQDVFVEAYGSLGTWRAEAPLGHWLRRIAVRVGYRFWSARARRPQALPEDWAPPVHDRGADDHDLAEWVHVQLGRLAPRDRLVLTLQSLEQHSVAEIAELTGWSQANVKVAAHRARKRLGALVGEQRP